MEEDSKTIYKSPTGVDLEVVKIANTALYGVTPSKGGVVPRECEGHFTTPGRAVEAIKNYFARVAQEQEKKTTVKTA